MGVGQLNHREGSGHYEIGGFINSMPISRNFIGAFQTADKRFDVGRFVEYATLFDRVVVEGFDYLTQIVRAFGVAGTLRLLEERCLGFMAGAGTLGRYDYANTGLGDLGRGLPPLSWFLEIIYVMDPLPAEKLQAAVERTRFDLRLSKHEANKLFDGIRQRMCTVDWPSIPAVDDFRHDLSVRPSFVFDVILNGLDNKLGRKIPREDVVLSVEETAEHTFTAHTNLTRLLGIDPQELHKLLGPEIGCLAGTNLRLGVMERVEAAVGLRDPEARVTRMRANLLGSLLCENDPREAFAEVLSIARIPTLSPGTRVDADSLLKVRATSECAAFRGWLRRSSDLNDEQLDELLNGWKARLGQISRSPAVVTLSWLASTGIGVVEPISGIALSAVEKFLINRLLPDPGPLAFLYHQYAPLIKESSSVKKK